MNKAVRVKQLRKWRGYAVLYKITPPYTREPDYDDDSYAGTFDYVIVSSIKETSEGFGAETMIFPGDENGEPIDMLDLFCHRGITTHKKALHDFGYELVK